MRTPVIRNFLLILAVLSLAGSTPAGESIARSGAASPSAIELAPSPDAVVANYERAVNERDLASYAGMLHEDFGVVVSGHGPDADGGWNRKLEIASMARLFSGRPGSTFSGELLGGVERIEFALVAADDWAYDSAGTETWSRTYHAFARLFLEDGSRRLITRPQVLTVAAVHREGSLAPSGFLMLRREHIGCDCPESAHAAS